LAILNPDHLLEQAQLMIVPPPAGPPRQVSLRRAISNAYYAIFHATLTAAGDEFIGVTQRSNDRYTLVYRSINHKALRDLCDAATKSQLPARLARYVPAGFDPQIKAFATAAVELQERRHSADYDPSVRFRSADAIFALKTSRAALESLRDATMESRKMFLSLLLFPPR
jgi:hypothetical protein